MKNKKRGGPKGLPGWMASYGDMVTVLMTFFILLYSMSIVDEDLFAAFIASFGAQEVIFETGMGGDLMIDVGVGLLPDNPPPPPTPPPGPIFEDDGGAGGPEVFTLGDVIANMENAFRTYMAQYIPIAPVAPTVTPAPGAYEDVVPGETEDEIIPIDEFEDSPIAISTDGQALIITFRDGVLFGPGQADLTSASIAVLDLVIPPLRQFVAEGHSIVVEGHTDNVPMNTVRFPSNRHLSSGRSDTVVEHLVHAHGFDPRVLRSSGMGEYWPIDTNDTPQGRANNRRVEIRVYANVNIDINRPDYGFLIPIED